MTGLAGLVLLVSLFLPWYSVAGVDENAWETLSVIDVILAVVALLAMALPVVMACQRTVSVPQSMTALLGPIALIGAVLALVRLIDAPGAAGTRQAGVVIASLAAIAIFVFDYRSMGDKRFPRSHRPPLDVAIVPAPTPDGTRRDVSA
jgi:hypothetical protein